MLKFGRSTGIGVSNKVTGTGTHQERSKVDVIGIKHSRILAKS